jgi:Protein of unknown function (DUF3168)
MSSSALAVQTALRDALLAHAPLAALLGGGHVFDEIPRGSPPPHVVFAGIETRDWSVQGQKAHEHFISIEVKTNSRRHELAQDIVAAIEDALDGAVLVLAGHALVNLHIQFWTVARDKASENFNAALRFRATTEPL